MAWVKNFCGTVLRIYPHPEMLKTPVTNSYYTIKVGKKESLAKKIKKGIILYVYVLFVTVQCNILKIKK